MEGGLQKAHIKNKKTKPSVSAVKGGWRKRGLRGGSVPGTDVLVCAFTTPLLVRSSRAPTTLSDKSKNDLGMLCIGLPVPSSGGRHLL